MENAQLIKVFYLESYSISSGTYDCLSPEAFCQSGG